VFFSIDNVIELFTCVVVLTQFGEFNTASGAAAVVREEQRITFGGSVLNRRTITV